MESFTPTSGTSYTSFITLRDSVICEDISYINIYIDRIFNNFIGLYICTFFEFLIIITVLWFILFLFLINYCIYELPWRVCCGEEYDID